MPKKLRGFAAMSPEKRRAVGRKGGKKTHQRGVSSQFDSERAKKAGKKSKRTKKRLITIIEEEYND